MKGSGRAGTWIAVLLLVPLLGCATAKEIVALRQVQFHLNGVTDARVAGISLDRVGTYGDLAAADLARLAISIAGGDVPLTLTLHSWTTASSSRVP